MTGTEAKPADDFYLRMTQSEWRAMKLKLALIPEMVEALDPETLDAIADEIDCFEHSARAAGLRGIAKRQRAILAKVRQS